MADNDTLFRNGGVHRLRRLFPGDDRVTVEMPLKDSIAQEVARLSGTKVRFYSLRRAKNRHPLYGEASGPNGGGWEFSGPWEMWANVEFDPASDTDTEATSEGSKKNADAKIYIPRKEFEDAESPDPKLGDVVEFWNLPGFQRSGNGFRYWDVTSAKPAQYEMSTEVFFMWYLELKAKSNFDPERKVKP